VRFSTRLPVIKGDDPRDPYADTFALARIAEESGFYSVTVGHHHFMPGSLADPLTFLTAIAVRTSTLRVATGIFQLPVHNPVRVAEQVATIDQLSNGRVSLGVGLGWWPLEYEVHGSNYHQRGGRLEEALEVLRLVWTRENVSFDGRYYSFPELTVYPRPVQQPHPPLFVAGVADAAVDRAARLGDAWLCGPVQSVGKAKACLAVYEPACARLEKAAEWMLCRFAWLGTDQREIDDVMLPRYVGGLLEHWRESAEDAEERALFARLDAGHTVSPQDIARDRLLWGTPDAFIRQIEDFRAATGCEHVQAMFGSGLPGSTNERSSMGSVDQLADMLRLFGREVIPAFAATADG
jgi:probable F420-dependent oxidoreductase